MAPVQKHRIPLARMLAETSLAESQELTPHNALPEAASRPTRGASLSLAPAAGVSRALASHAVIVLNTPRGDFIEISSSSYELPIFSSKAGSQHNKGAVAVQRESSSVSVGNLWPEIDSLDEASRDGTSVTATRCHLRNSSFRLQLGSGGSKLREGMLNTGERALLAQALGPLSPPPKGYGGGSNRSKVAQILLDAPKDTSSRMKRLFVNREYSSTGTDRSEWEIFLEQLTIVGYIVKKEPESETDD
jgi:hypothetical protein